MVARTRPIRTGFAACHTCGGEMIPHEFGVCLECYATFWETLTDAQKGEAFEPAGAEKHDVLLHLWVAGHA